MNYLHFLCHSLHYINQIKESFLFSLTHPFNVSAILHLLFFAMRSGGRAKKIVPTSFSPSAIAMKSDQYLENWNLFLVVGPRSRD